MPSQSLGRILYDIIRKYIFEDETLRNVSDMDAVIRRIKRMFSDPDYRKELHKSGKNWMDISDDEAMQKLMAFLESIRF